MKLLSVTWIPLAGCLSAPLLAQAAGTPIPVTQSQGMFTGHPFGLQHADVAGVDPLVQIRTQGVETGSVVPWTAATFGPIDDLHPDYSPGALFGHWVLAGSPELGSLSSGGDVTPPVDGAGRLDMSGQNTSWYVLSFTVDDEAVGEPGSVVAQANAAAGMASGYLFSYGAEGSQGIRQEFVDSSRVDYTRDQVGLPPTREITALDWGMGLISVTPGGQATRLQPVRDCLYFTITKRWIDNNPGMTPILGPLDPATVYFMTWNGAVWSDPDVAFDHDALFGPGAALGAEVEIDGLSVYLTNEMTPELPARVVFSLTREEESTINGSEPNQVLVSQRPGPQGPAVYAQPLQTPGGVRMTEKAGLLEGGPGGDPDNVRGLCGRDPDEIGRRDVHVGYPVDDPNGPADVQADLGISMLRYGDFLSMGAGQGELLLQASGIDVPGYDLGILVFELQIYDVTNNSNVLLATSESNPLPVLPQQLTAQLELPMNFTPALLGQELELRVRAHLHGLVLSPWTIEKDVATSWWTVIDLL